jgi:hypothetical protein
MLLQLVFSLLIYLSCTTNQRIIPFGYVLSFAGSGSSCLFSVVFITEEVVEVGDKGP